MVSGESSYIMTSPLRRQVCTWLWMLLTGVGVVAGEWWLVSGT